MDREIVVLRNFPQLCRLCLNFGELEPLEKYESLLKCINLEVKLKEPLPKNICLKCLTFLQNISKFIEVFKKSDTYLHQILAEDIDFSDDEDKWNEEYFEENVPVLSEVPKKVSNKSLSNHTIICVKKGCSTKEYICNICGNVFVRSSGLKRHMKIHTGIKPFKCGKCDKCFQEKVALERHTVIHTGVKPFECNLCGTFTRRKDQIIEHIQRQHPLTTDYIAFITKHELTGLSDNKFASELNCINDEGRKPDRKNVILKTKKRIEICLCNLCGKVFRRRGYLKNHMAIHAKIKPFSCNICGKSFTQRHVLTRHYLVHTKERPFQCNLCGKTFTRKEILSEHLKNHDGNNKYLCFHCGKSFANKEYLSKHLKYFLSNKSRSNTKNNKCTCPECGKVLHSASYLKTHLLTHSGDKPHECKICEKKFSVYRTLKTHMEIHKGIKPYQCKECEKCFRTSNSLKKHMFLHSNIRPYKCSSCEKAFIRTSHLNRHLKIHRTVK